MASLFNPAVITNKGTTLLAKLQLGEVTGITFTKTQTGDGTYTQGEDLASKTALKSAKQTFGYDSFSRVNTNEVCLKFTATNHQESGDLQTGYYIKEVGVFATDPDEGEILYSIATAVTDQWDYMPAYDGAESTITMSFYTAISSADDITIDIVPSAYLSTDGNASDTTATFSQAETLTEPVSGSKLSVLFGLMSKAIKSIIDHLTDDVKHITDTERTTWNAKLGTTDTASKAQADGAGNDIQETYVSKDETIPIAHGGTGATTAANARAALGVAYGTAAGTVCQGNDSRLSNSRTPTAHSHSAADITSGILPVANGGTGSSSAANARTALGVAYGTTAGTVCQGNDSRLSDSRTPVAHTHTKSQITDFPTTMAPSAHNQAASTITAGTLPTGVLATNGTDYSTSRLRNIKASTTDLVAGTSALTNGTIYIVYE